jgi:hypothetical protein
MAIYLTSHIELRGPELLRVFGELQWHASGAIW